MTTSYQLVSVGTATSLTSTKSTEASVLGRIAPVNREYSSSGTLRPYVLPWTEVTDTVGCAYPAGLVAVVGAWSVDAGPGSYTGKIDDYFDDNSALVPGVLPVGYTARWERDEYFSATTVGQARVPSFLKYRDADGPVDIDWVPVAAIDARGRVGSALTPFTVITGPGYPGDLCDYWIMMKIQAPCVGWRGFKYIYTIYSGDDPADYVPPGFGTWSGNVTITISHNADGTDPLTDNGDTIDHVQTFAYGDFVRTDVLPAVPRWRYVTAEIDVGPLIPALGVLTVYRFKIQGGMPTAGCGSGYANGLPQGGASPFSIKFSANLDVPFPYTATGDDDLIAPGGLVT